MGLGFLATGSQNPPETNICRIMGPDYWDSGSEKTGGNNNWSPSPMDLGPKSRVYPSPDFGSRIRTFLHIYTGHTAPPSGPVACAVGSNALHHIITQPTPRSGLVMEPASRVGGSDRHVELQNLLGAAVRRCRERGRFARTVDVVNAANWDHNHLCVP